MWSIHTVKHYSAIKQTTDVCHNMEESQERYAKWRTSEKTTYYIGNGRKSKAKDRKQISCCQRLGVRGRRWLERGTRVLFGVMETFYLIMSVVLMCTFVKIHQIVHLKLVAFIQCKLYHKFKNKLRATSWMPYKVTTSFGEIIIFKLWKPIFNKILALFVFMLNLCKILTPKMCLYRKW